LLHTACRQRRQTVRWTCHTTNWTCWVKENKPKSAAPPGIDRGALLLVRWTTLRQPCNVQRSATEQSLFLLFWPTARCIASQSVAWPALHRAWSLLVGSSRRETKQVHRSPTKTNQSNDERHLVVGTNGLLVTYRFDDALNEHTCPCICIRRRRRRRAITECKPSTLVRSPQEKKWQFLFLLVIATQRPASSPIATLRHPPKMDGHVGGDGNGDAGSPHGSSGDLNSTSSSSAAAR
jgi:hypothetical protein